MSRSSRMGSSAVCVLVVTGALAGVLVLTRPSLTAAASPASLRLVPAVGPPTKQVTASATGFPGDARLTVRFGSVKVATATTTRSGAASIAFTVPRVARPGPHTVSVSTSAGATTAKSTLLVRTNWPGERDYASGAAFNPYENVLSRSSIAQATTQWTATTPGQITSGESVVNGIVYIASNGTSDQTNYLSAYDASTGATLWSQDIGDEDWTEMAPTVANGTLYVTDDTTTSAYDALTGRDPGR